MEVGTVDGFDVEDVTVDAAEVVIVVDGAVEDEEKVVVVGGV